MSRLMVISFRNGCEDNLLETKLETLNKHLAPDHISPQQPIIKRKGKIIVSVLNPSPTVQFEGKNVCLGHMFEKRDDCFNIGSPAPDGSFAMVRVHGDEIELLTDKTASRTIWYVKTNKYFAASSSARALICLLGSFEPNKNAFAWMLSSGTLGPGYSWDSRIKLLYSQSSLLFDNIKWQMTIKTQPITFNTQDSPYHIFQKQTLAILNDIFSHIDTKKHTWIVPLSGGYDSRLILMLLNNRERVRAATWGRKASLEDKDSDAAIAPRVANALSVPHKFYPTDIASCPLNVVLDRFISTGEGRVDHVGGYLDGFNIWKTFFDEGHEAILRGDVCWPHIGSPPVDFFDVRQNASIWLVRLCDYSNLPTCTDLELPDQNLPEDLLPGEKETFATYRDRIYQAFRMPIVLSALNELKSNYIEVINPFCSSRFIDLVRKQPDAIRNDKMILREYVHTMGPKVPIARHPSTQSFETFWEQIDLKDILNSELHSDFSRQLLSSSVLRIANIGIENMGKKQEPNKTEQLLMPPMRYLRKAIKQARNKFTGPRPWGKTHMSYQIFAFRAFIIARTCRLFYKDSQLFH